jgi:pimeloyl-ACP methyl ester carboxylesterase
VSEESVEGFRISIDASAVQDLRDRLATSRWPEKEPVDDWSQGVPEGKLRALCDYWADGYDWRRCEARLNAFPNFRTMIDGLAIHFIHRRSPRDDATPLILTHGWPGSIIEFLGVIDALADPEDPEAPAFHVVAPSIPGYGFSGKPRETGWTTDRIGEAWSVLMRRLGYGRFISQGGDAGAAISIAMASRQVEGLAAIHLNMPMIYPQPDMGPYTPSEQAYADVLAQFARWGGGYAGIQGTRPQTLGYLLSESPIGQAAWIYEKYQAWSQNGGDPEDALSRDEMLDNISLYWFTNTGASAARLYWETATVSSVRKIDLPVGISLFPEEILRPSRRWVDRFYSNVIYWNEAARGGHFAAWEQPQLFVEELRQFARALSFTS